MTSKMVGNELTGGEHAVIADDLQCACCLAPDRWAQTSSQCMEMTRPPQAQDAPSPHIPTIVSETLALRNSADSSGAAVLAAVMTILGGVNCGSMTRAGADL